MIAKLFEITLDDPKNTTFVQHMMNERNFNAKIIKRRNRLVIYLKEAEKMRADKSYSR